MPAYAAPTYHHNDKVQPTPRIGKVLCKAKGEPLDEHFKEKYYCEEFVRVSKIFHENLVPLEIHVFQGLSQGDEITYKLN